MIRKLSSLAFCISLAVVLMLVMTTSSSATDKVSQAQPSNTQQPESAAAKSAGAQCRAPIGGEAVRTELRQGRAGVERSAPGT